MATSALTHTPVTSTRTVTRVRSFRIVCMRPDFRDALAQLLTLVQQLHDERLTGTLTLNFGQGGITTAEVRDSQKI